MELILKRDPNADGEEFYLVHHHGGVVGRIFNRLAGTGASRDATWFWGLGFYPHWKQPTYGNAATREAAMVAFRARWDAGPMLKKA
jgi:hypothetical protein